LRRLNTAAVTAAAAEAAAAAAAAALLYHSLVVARRLASPRLACLLPTACRSPPPHNATDASSQTVRRFVYTSSDV